MILLSGGFCSLRKVTNVYAHVWPTYIQKTPDYNSLKNSYTGRTPKFHAGYENYILAISLIRPMHNAHCTYITEWIFYKNPFLSRSDGFYFAISCICALHHANQRSYSKNFFIPDVFWTIANFFGSAENELTMFKVKISSRRCKKIVGESYKIIG